jgi:hypothetical protein
MRRNPNNHAHPSLRDAVDVTRFWNLVGQYAPSECWPWQGDTDRAGYGIFVWHGRKMGAHELALSFTTGEARLPDLETCHSCDNPPCCNPAHLRFATHASNVAEMYARGRARHRTKLTAEMVVTMRKRRAAGARQRDLAEQFGITEGQVSMIVRGIRWPDAGGPIETERKYRNGR